MAASLHALHLRHPERQNIKVVANPSLTAATHNPYLLSPAEERSMKQKQRDNRERLQVPRRPAWTRATTVLELERSERDSFLEWRRGLAEYVDVICPAICFAFYFLCPRPDLFLQFAVDHLVCKRTNLCYSRHSSETWKYGDSFGGRASDPI